MKKQIQMARKIQAIAEAAIMSFGLCQALAKRPLKTREKALTYYGAMLTEIRLGGENCDMQIVMAAFSKALDCHRLEIKLRQRNKKRFATGGFVPNTQVDIGEFVIPTKKPAP